MKKIIVIIISIIKMYVCMKMYLKMSFGVRDEIVDLIRRISYEATASERCSSSRLYVVVGCIESSRFLFFFTKTFPFGDMT